MSNWLKKSGSDHNGLGIDAELSGALQSLDPATQDPNYWFRFRGWVVKSAARELARRRIVAQLTVGDVMSSWARTIVPTAVLAAAMAGMLLVRSSAPPAPQPPGLEELLVSELQSEAPPALQSTDGTEGGVIFASSEIF